MWFYIFSESDWDFHEIWRKRVSWAKGEMPQPGRPAVIGRFPDRLGIPRRYLVASLVPLKGAYCIASPGLSEWSPFAVLERYGASERLVKELKRFGELIYHPYRDC